MDDKSPLHLWKTLSKNEAVNPPFDAVNALENQGNFLKHHLERLKAIEIKLNQLDHLANKNTKGINYDTTNKT